MKQYIANLLPARILVRLRSIRARLRLFREFRIDGDRYAAAAAPYPDSSDASLSTVQMSAQLTKDYHRVEKGLALANPRRPFGREVEERLTELLDISTARGVPPHIIKSAEDARVALRAWNLRGVIDEAVAPQRNQYRGLTSPRDFFLSRSSSRNFDKSRAVSEDTLLEALQLAIHSPSVCNRQPWRVRIFRDDEAQKVLAFQNGNAGFRDVVSAVVLVSVEADRFAGPGERNQPWIEGGIFSAGLVWALHSMGVSTCMLNLSLTSQNATSLRRAVEMGESELPIVMIACGYVDDSIRIARSAREPLTEFLRVGRVVANA